MTPPNAISPCAAGLFKRHFEPEQLRALAFVREQDESLSFGRDRELAELMEQVGGLLPTDALRQRAGA